MVRKINPWLLVCSAALLLVLSWPPLPFPFLVFFAFVPLFMLEDHHYQIADRPLVYYFQVSLVFTIFSAGTTWWTWFASPPGAVAAIVLSGQLQTIPWLLFHRSRKQFGDRVAYPALFSTVIAFEYLQCNWDLAWPWLNFGNVFAGVPWAVQWYSVTGTFGGTLWILLMALVLFRLIVQSEKRLVYGIGAFCLLVLPLIASVSISSSYESKIAKMEMIGHEVIVVQPNIDPYTDKFNGMSPEEQLELLFRLSDSLVTGSTELMLWPETALTSGIVEDNLSGDPTIQRIQNWVDKYPKLMLVSGANTYHFFASDEKLTATARKTPYDENLHYDVYNSALGFVAGKKIQVYHKARLVPGVEKMPYPEIFGFLESLAIDLGGTSGSLGSSDSAVVFENGDLKVAPIICYESVFGEYAGEYVRNGAGILTIITNDGWWKDTPGYKQHHQYARLRAIENRMYVCRSANTGVSGFIDPLGNSLAESGWWVPAVMKYTVSQAPISTFYARYGDYLGRMAAAIAVIVVIAGFIRRKSHRR